MTARNRRWNRVRRPWFESLEKRDCPAVLFDFEQGVLRVTGDAGPNVVEYVQTGDRSLDIVGDGERRTYEGVDAVFVSLGEGDDQAMSSKPKEIVVVGSKIKEVFEMGSGNDRVLLSDGGPGAAINQTPLDYEVNLGAGADELVVQLQHHDLVDLMLTADDGGDSILVGMLLPAVQKIREADARVQAMLPGGGDQIEVRAIDFDQLDLTLDVPSPAEKPAATINVYVHVIHHSPGSSVDPEDSSRLSLDLRLGDGSDQVALSGGGYANVSLNVDAAGGDDLVGWNWVSNSNNPAALQAAIDLGEGNNELRFDARGAGSLDLDLIAGIGNDQIHTLFVRNHHRLSLPAEPSVDVVARLGGGNDSIWIDMSMPVRINSEGAPRAAGMFVDLGEGDDTLEARLSGFDEVDFELLAGEGNDAVAVRANDRLVNAGPITGSPARGSNQGFGKWEVNLALAGGDDVAQIETAGFADVSDLLDAGDGDDEVRVRHRMFAIVDRSQFILDAMLGAGDDALFTEGVNYLKAGATIDLGVGDDRFDGKYYVVGATHKYSHEPSHLGFALALGEGSDALRLAARGYDEVNGLVNTGPAGGQDTIEVNVAHLPSRLLLRESHTFDDGLDHLLLRAKGYEDVLVTPSASDEREFSITASTSHPHGDASALLIAKQRSLRDRAPRGTSGR